MDLDKMSCSRDPLKGPERGGEEAEKRGGYFKEANGPYSFQGKETQNVKKTIAYFIGVFAC
jgi:hypothetical protein